MTEGRNKANCTPYLKNSLNREELDILGDIKIEDGELQRVLDIEGPESIMVYGELNPPLDRDEQSVMVLNPKLCLFEKVTVKGVRSDLEESPVIAIKKKSLVNKLDDLARREYCLLSPREISR